MNTNKNKLKNIGAHAIIEGILDTENYSLMSEINLSYNYLTSECLGYFALLHDPEFIQLQHLNLSHNDLGPESIEILGQTLCSIVELNLANTKLNSQSMVDLATSFRRQDMKLRYLDVSGNNISTEGFYELLVALKNNIRVKSLNFSRNPICNDLKQFRMSQRFLLCNKTLENLNLSYCNIKEKGIQVIAKGLKGNRSL